MLYPGITSTATAISQAIASGGQSSQANALAIAYALGTSSGSAVAQVTHFLACFGRAS